MADSDVLNAIDDGRVTTSHWRTAALAASASYFDAGSIVAGATALPLWTTRFGLTSTTVGLIAAFGSNGISTGFGALVGGWLGDRFGRRIIYTWDLLFYIIGVLVVVFATSLPVVIAGYVLMGLAVGADIPNSMALLAEIAPKNSRSKLVGLGPVLWYAGPLVVTILGVALHSTGLLGARIIFAHLAVVALAIWFLRRKMVESPRWQQVQAAKQERAAKSAGRPSQAKAFRAALPAFLFLAPLVTVWNIPAGTYGFFFPYLLNTAGAHSQFAADFLNMLLFVIGIVTLAIFMLVGDRINRRLSYAIFSAIAAIAFLLFVIFSVKNTAIVVANVVLMGIGGFSATFHVWSVWNTELFETSVRSSAQGWVVASMRFALGVWSIFLPAITGHLGFSVVALMLMGMYLFGVVFGGLFGPSTQGRPLEQIRFSWKANFGGAKPGASATRTPVR